MNNLYNKIYEAINTGIQKALIISDDQSDDSSVKFHNKEISAGFVPYEYRFVDMGLESGLLWAEYNLGAFPGNKAKDWYGDYYAWGETDVKTDYTWKTYKHCNGSEHSLIKYNTNKKSGKVDDKKILDINDDVVTQTLGEQYRMPIKEDFEELLGNTTNKWVKNYKGIYGLNGRLFTSKINSKTLFFPAAGYFDGSELSGACSFTFIWSASLNSDYPDCAFDLYFYSAESYVIYGGYRYYGLSVRGVYNSQLK